MEHVIIRVFGVVQGVFFRVHTKEKADSLNLKGFVRNEEDGSVYIEAEGPSHKIDELILWCHKGPEKARVSRVVTESGSFRNFPDFEIQR